MRVRFLLDEGMRILFLRILLPWRKQKNQIPHEIRVSADFLFGADEKKYQSPPALKLKFCSVFFFYLSY